MGEEPYMVTALTLICSLKLKHFFYLSHRQKTK